MIKPKISVLCIISSRERADAIYTVLNQEYSITQWKWLKGIPKQKITPFIPTLVIVQRSVLKQLSHVKFLKEQFPSSIHILLTTKSILSQSLCTTFDAILSIRELKKLPEYVQHCIFNSNTPNLYDNTLSLEKNRLFYELQEERKKVTDLTEQLKHYEELFTKAFLTTPDAVNINRLHDGLYIAVNEGFTSLTGYTSDDVKGKTSLELSIWANPDDRKRLVEELKAHGKVKDFEAQFRLKDGSVRTGIMSASIVTVNGELCILSITRDITERKIIENRYRTLFESSPDPIVLFDENFIVCGINQRAVNVWGAADKEYFIGKSILEFLVPEDRPRAIESNKKFLDSMEPRTAVYTLLRPNTTTLSCEVNVARFPQEPGGKRLYIAILRDITEKLRTQQELQLLAHALKSIHESVIIVDQQGTVLYVNEQFEKVYGFSAREVQSQQYTTIIFPGIVDEVEIAFEQCRKEGEWNGELVHRKKDGTLFPVHSAFYRIVGEDNKIVSFVNIVQDLTQGRKIEEVLRKIVRGTSTSIGAEFFKTFVYHLSSALMVDVVFVGSLDDQNPTTLKQVTYWRGKYEESNVPIVLEHTELSFLTLENRDFFYPSEIQQSFQQKMFPDSTVHIVGVVPLRDNDNIVRGLIVLAHGYPKELTRQEIAVLKIFASRAAAELRRLKAEEEWKKLLLAVEYNPIAIAIVTQDHRVEYVNPQFTAITGHALMDIKGQPIYSIPFDQADLIRNLLTNAIDGDIVVSKRGRKSITSYVRAIPIITSNKTVSHYVILIEDFTQRRTIEERLRLSEQRLQEIFENDITGNYVCLPDGKILDCNSAFVAMFGFASYKEACSTLMSTLYKDNECFPLIVEMIREKKKILHAEYEMKRVDGKVLYVVQNILGIYNDDGTLREIFGYIYNNTERHLLELQARQSQKMELIGTLAGGIAHDFNNILNNIIGFSTQARRHVYEPERVLRYCNSIEKSAARGAQIARQLLHFSRLKDAEQEIVDIGDILQELSSLIRDTFPQTIILKEDIADDLHTVYGDRGALYEVFLNLCVNARDAMPNGGLLTIRAYNRSVGTEVSPQLFTVETHECVCVEVTDTGIGIDEKDLPRIFEPFYTTKEKGKGTGLGLSIAYNAVKNSGGSIVVESKVNYGTTFTVYLPAAQEKQTIESNESSTLPRAQGECILLVDDEEAMLILGREILEERGFRVLTASNGVEAVELYAKRWREIDLVILDLIMPLKDGGQTYLEMKEINPTLKAIFCSGYTSSKLITQLLEHEHLSAIQKPFKDEELLEMVFKVLTT
ncbi:MAG: PAS domain S-box protein [Bacteroidetes bacterium]|nr:PAS domain S-box protein [Bacteroidota bacterium]